MTGKDSSAEVKTDGNELEVATDSDNNDAGPETTEVDEEMNTNTAEDASDQDETEQLRNELEVEKDRYVRLLAEFDNFRKRVTKERADLLKYQGEKIVLDLLEVIDNLELALSTPGSDYDKLKSGLEMIHKMFVDTLAKWEIKGESAIGSEFNPAQHSAISKIKSEASKPGTVVGELKKPYFYKDKLLRPGDVVVAIDEE